MDEVAFALENNKTVVPVLHTRCAIPFRIQRLQYIDFTTTYNNGLTRLLSALNVVQSSQATQASAPDARAGEAAPGTARSQLRMRKLAHLSACRRLVSRCSWNQLLGQCH